jgi:hypothetical protein
MFSIYISVLDPQGVAREWREVSGGFAERSDAVKLLDGLVASKATSAGYDKENDHWWTRYGDVETRYTIGPGTTAP